MLSEKFTRDRFTWLAYAMLAFFSYMQNTLGPIMPFLRSELQLSYAAGGLHVSAFALGMIIAGISAASLATRWARRTIFWAGAGGMAVGALGLITATHIAFTLTSVLVMGTMGTLLLVMLQAGLSDHHGHLRATALVEANIAAMLCAGLAALTVGFFQTTPIGWRGAILSALVAVSLLTLFNWRTPIPQRPSISTAHEQTRLPRLFWAYWVVLVLSVGIEWSIVGWGAEFLNSEVGLDAAVAASYFSVFFLGALLGRIANSRWTQRTSPRKLLLMMEGVVALGFPLLWLATRPIINIAGLGITGFGVGALFPLGLSVALTIAADQANKASARIALGGGLAILLAPFTLGWLADALNLSAAFGVVAVLLAAATVVTYLAGRSEGEQ
jgi:fucose permease